MYIPAPPRFITRGDFSLLSLGGQADAAPASAVVTLPQFTFGPQHEENREIFALVIGGSATTKIIKAVQIGSENAILSRNSAGSASSAWLVARAKYAPATGFITVTSDATLSNCAAICWAAYNCKTPGEAEVGFAQTNTASGTSLTISTVTIPPGGFLIGGVVLGSSAAVGVSGGPTETYEVATDSSTKEAFWQGPVIAPLIPSVQASWSPATAARIAVWSFQS